MSQPTPSSDRERVEELRRLCEAQVRALEADDMPAFDRIMVDKDTLIAAFADVRRLLESDTSLAAVVQQIQDADKSAQLLLYQKTGRILHQLTELQQQKRARHAYYAPAPKAPGFSQPNGSRFMDRKS